MDRRKTRFLSALLSICMVLTLLPMSVFASQVAPVVTTLTDLSVAENWVSDRTEPVGFAIGNGKITFGVAAQPAAESFYAYQGRKALTGAQVKNNWSVEYTFDITQKMLTTDNVNASLWIQVDKAGVATVESQENCVDWCIVQYINKAEGGPCWQTWNSSGVWKSVTATPTAGTHAVRITFDNGVICQYIDNLQVNTYTIDTFYATAPAALIVQGRSYGSAFGVSIGVPKVIPAAKIGETEYYTLAEAVTAAKSGDTITLLGDVTLANTLTINENVTLDLGGFTITGDDGIGNVLHFSGGTSTVKNGTVDGNGTATNAIRITGSAVVTVEATATAQAFCGIAVRNGTSAAAPATLHMYGKAIGQAEYPVSGKADKFYGSYGIAGNGTAGHGNTLINIYASAEITAEAGNSGNATDDAAAAIYHPQDGILNIHGGTITGPEGLEIKAGTANIYGGYFRTNVINEQTAHPSSNGPSATGYAIALVENDDYAQPAIVNISGTSAGRFFHRIAILDDDGATGNVGKINISGGEFYNCTIENKADADNTGKAISITGGHYSQLCPPDTKYLADTYFVGNAGEGNPWPKIGYTVSNNAEAKIGDVPYGTLYDALNAVPRTNEATTVTLQKDVSVTGAFTAYANQNIVLDLGGHKLTNDGTAFLCYNTMEFKNGTLEVTSDEAVPAIRICGGGKITIAKNATIKGPYAIGTVGALDSVATVAVYGTLTGGHGAIAINGTHRDEATAPVIKIYDGATLTGTGEGSVGVYAGGYAKWTITGGAFSGSTAFEIKNGALEISGGTFDATGTVGTNFAGDGSSTTGYALAVVDNASYGPVTATISGGTFKGPIAKLDADAVAANNNDTFAISGGDFTADPAQYVASGHYVADGTSRYPYSVIAIPEKVATVPPVVPEPTVAITGTPTDEETTLANTAATAAASTTISQGASALSTLATGSTIETTGSGERAQTVVQMDNNTTKPVAEVIAEVKEAATASQTAPQNIQNAELANLTVVVQPYLDIKVTDVDIPDSGMPTVTLNITPMSQVLVTTTTAAAAAAQAENPVMLDGTNAVKVGTPQPVPVPKNVPVTIKTEIPEVLAALDTVKNDRSYLPLNIKHEKDNNRGTYYYIAEVTKEADKYYATFTVTNGFSKFTLQAADARKLTVDFDVSGIEDVTYSITDIGDALPTATKSGYRFTGWLIGGKVYTELTDALWMAHVTATTVTATAQFSQNVSTPQYAITVAAATGGSVSANVSQSRADAAITLTVKPDEGYFLQSLTVKAGDSAVETAKNADGAYTFTMPAAAVTVTPVFALTEWVNPFSDVKENAWYYDAVKFVNQQSLFSGYPDGTFRPAAEMNRGMLVTVLWRLEGQPTVDYLMSFTDVPADEYYTEAVRWAASQKIVDGYGDNTFRPGKSITRQELAAMLYRYAESKGYDLTATADLSAFVDANLVQSYAEAPLRWAVGNELVNGLPGMKLDPTGPALRAQVAAVMMRFCQNAAK